MKTLHFVWHALITADEDSCGRCGKNYYHLQNAVEKLKEILRPKGIVPRLQTRSITEREFHSNRLHEHQLLIENEPIENWLTDSQKKLIVQQICHDESCRHLPEQDRTYESINEMLVIEAGLQAALSLEEKSF